MSDPSDFEMLLEYIKRNRGFDFSGYKRTGLMRRINKRMTMVGQENFGDYLDYLEVHPGEFIHLFNTILINVTGFFRDPEAWEMIKNRIIPAIIANKGPHQPIRAWSAGCASGEEAYSLAMLLAETLGIEDYMRRVKIYATDLDEAALMKGRQASYTLQEVENVPGELLDKYFEQTGAQYTFRKDLRRFIIFGKHDLLQDAPITKIDLLACRNTLMYFNAETQARVLARLHLALNERGFLILGKAEVMTHANMFSAVWLKGRVFTKVTRMDLRDRLAIIPQDTDDLPGDHLINQVQMCDMAFDAGPTAQLVISSNGILALANEAARNSFGLTQKDIGTNFSDLQISIRPVELRTPVEQANKSRVSVILRDVIWHPHDEETRYLEVHLVPLVDTDAAVIGTSILFIDQTKQKVLQQQVERTNQELETTNEELQSTIEELVTTNEELQSTNEELETMNEEMRVRTEELNQMNAFMESILTSLRGGVVVLDQDLRVRSWNVHAENQWGLRAEEVEGHNFLNLDIGLPVDQLKRPIRAALSGESLPELTLNATNRRGREISCSVTCTPLYSFDRRIQGVIIMVVDGDGHAATDTSTD